MPYISFTAPPQTTGRTVRDACTDPATGAYVCEVDEVLDGDTEISADEHARIKQAADAWYEANPPVAPEPEPKPITPLEIIANAILADAGTSTALKEAARAAIVAGGEVVSDKIVPMVPRG